MITPLKTIKNISIATLLLALSFFSINAPVQALNAYQRAYFARQFAHDAQGDASRQHSPHYGQNFAQGKHQQTAGAPRSTTSARNALAKPQAQPKRSTWDIIGQTANKISTAAHYVDLLNPYRAATELITYLIPQEALGILKLANGFVPGIEDKSIEFISDKLFMAPLNMFVGSIDDSSSTPLKAFKKLMQFYTTPGRASLGEKLADFCHGADALEEAKTRTKKYVGMGAIALDLTRLTAATYNLQQCYLHNKTTQQIPFCRYLVPRIHEFAKTHQDFVQKYAQDSTVLKKGAEIVATILPYLEASTKPLFKRFPLLNKLDAIDLTIHLCRTGLNGAKDLE